MSRPIDRYRVSHHDASRYKIQNIITGRMVAVFETREDAVEFELAANTIDFLAEDLNAMKENYNNLLVACQRLLDFADGGWADTADSGLCEAAALMDDDDEYDEIIDDIRAAVEAAHLEVAPVDEEAEA